MLCRRDGQRAVLQCSTSYSSYDASFTGHTGHLVEYVVVNCGDSLRCTRPVAQRNAPIAVVLATTACVPEFIGLNPEYRVMDDIALKNLHCLVVDDQTTTLRAIDAMLRVLGVAKVTSARNGADALTKLDGSHSVVDCILSRLWMQGGNGLQLLKAIRSGQARSTRLDACFILFTPEAHPGAIAVAASLDAHGVLVKPITAEKLLSAIISGRTRNFAADMARYASQAVPEYRPPAM